MKRLFKPFEKLKGSSTTTILVSWLVILFTFWGLNSFGTTHMFPTPSQVFHGLQDLWREGLVVHIGSSLALCGQAVLISIIISLMFAYTSAIPFFKPVGTFISKLRYLPLTGIAFYLAVLVQDARNLQVWVLVVFMTTFLTTGLMQMIKDIPEDEEPTKQELSQMAIELASDASKIYNKGFNEAIELIAKCDSKFLSRKVPPHVLA